EKEALQRLTQQALKEVDFLWRAQLSDGDDISAKAFLAANQQTFTNDLGEQQKFFTAIGQQLFRPEMFANTTDPAFYKQFAQSGISRELTTGLMKELKDSGVDIKNSAVNLAKAVNDNPGLVLNAAWEAVKALPQSVVDSFKETGIAIGEGAAVALDSDLTAKLNAIYGTDTAGMQKALLMIRIAASVTGATGTAKAGTQLSEATAKAVGKKLDDVAAAKVEAKALSDRMKEIAIHKDDSRFDSVAEKMLEAEKSNWKTAEGKIQWPPENGKVPGTELQVSLPVGTKLDRYGPIDLQTDFLAPAGTPIEARALPSGSETRPLVKLEVIKPLPVEQSNAMPWFGQPGMGVQYQTTTGKMQLTVQQLIDLGYLRIIDK
ncbi:MAG: TNT domain-containing protein, partial [Candidatus Obscuribacterales bacterium]|nr:TNT domain-containing protein [Candidatus Obscuribacterales bacterium]